MGLVVVAAEMVDQARGCGFVDPTDPANYNSLRIVNDEAASVTVDSCESSSCDIVSYGGQNYGR